MADDRGEPVLLAAIAAAGLLAASFAWSPAKPASVGQEVAPPKSGREGPAAPKASSSDTHPQARGAWPVMKRVFAGFNDDRIMTEAAGVTFYALLALFPAIATLVSLYGFFADPATVAQQLQGAAGIIPGGGLDIIETQVKSLTANGRTALGWGVLIGLLTSLWSANQGIKSMCDALNVVYHKKETRGYIKLTMISLGLTLSGIMFLLVAMVAVVAIPVALNFVGFGSWADTLPSRRSED